MEKETKIRIGLLLRAAIEDTGAEFAEASFAFYCAEDDSIALVPHERCALPGVSQLMEAEGLDRLDAVAKVVGEKGFTLLGLLAVRLTEGREPFIEYEEAPGASLELIEAAKQIFWDSLIEQGKIAPKTAGAEA